jgi:hypothetical protein
VVPRIKLNSHSALNYRPIRCITKYIWPNQSTNNYLHLISCMLEALRHTTVLC